MFSTWRPFHPSTIGGHDKITSAFSYRILVKSFPLPKPSNCKSMNNAITSILMGKLNALNSWRNSLQGKLSDCVETGEDASNQLQGEYQIRCTCPDLYPRHRDIYRDHKPSNCSYSPKTQARPERNRSGQ